MQSTSLKATSPKLPKLLSEQEAAKLLDFSPRTLQKWRWTGGGPRYVQVSARCIRYRPDDLLTWIESRLRSSTADGGTLSGAEVQ